MNMYSVGVTFLEEDEDPISFLGGQWEIDKSGALIIFPISMPDETWTKLQVFSSGAWIWFEMEIVLEEAGS